MTVKFIGGNTAYFRIKTGQELLSRRWVIGEPPDIGTVDNNRYLAFLHKHPSYNDVLVGVWRRRDGGLYDITVDYIVTTDKQKREIDKDVNKLERLISRFCDSWIKEDKRLAAFYVTYIKRILKKYNASVQIYDLPSRGVIVDWVNPDKGILHFYWIGGVNQQGSEYSVYVIIEP